MRDISGLKDLDDDLEDDRSNRRHLPCLSNACILHSREDFDPLPLGQRGGGQQGCGEDCRDISDGRRANG